MLVFAGYWAAEERRSTLGEEVSLEKHSSSIRSFFARLVLTIYASSAQSKIGELPVFCLSFCKDFFVNCEFLCKYCLFYLMIWIMWRLLLRAYIFYFLLWICFSIIFKSEVNVPNNKRTVGKSKASKFLKYILLYIIFKIYTYLNVKIVNIMVIKVSL